MLATVVDVSAPLLAAGAMRGAIGPARTKCGSIRANATAQFDVSAGAHEVQLFVGPIYGSPVVTVEVGERDVTMICGPSAIPLLAILSLAEPKRWIKLQVRAVDE